MSMDSVTSAIHSLGYRIPFYCISQLFIYSSFLQINWMHRALPYLFNKYTMITMHLWTYKLHSCTSPITIDTGLSHLPYLRVRWSLKSFPPVQQWLCQSPHAFWAAPQRCHQIRRHCPPAKPHEPPSTSQPAHSRGWTAAVPDTDQACHVEQSTPCNTTAEEYAIHFDNIFCISGSSKCNKHNRVSDW